MCDNDYVKVAVTMPERPTDYLGHVDKLIEVEEEFEKVEEEKATKEAEEAAAAEEDEGMELWVIIVGISGLIIVLMIFGVAIYYCVSCCRRK